MKRILTLLLATVMLLSVVACAKDKDNKKDEENKNPTNETVEKQWDKKKYDLSGEDFTIISRTNTGAIPGFNGTDINIEEITGNEVLDEVYYRNRLIEQTYNCVIVQNDQAGNASSIKTIVLGGDDSDCKLIATSARIATELIPDDLLYDLNSPELVNLNLKAEWYDQNIQKDLAIKGNNYMINGDMLFSDDNSIWLTLFNKELAERFLPEVNLYNVVKEGKWTLDTMSQYAALATKELVADDKMDEHDQWGLLSEPGNIAANIGGCEYRYAEVTEDGGIQSNVFNNTFLDIFTKCMNAMDGSFTLLSSDLKGYANVWDDAYNPMFSEGRVLFMVTSMYRCILFREMQADFGILPLPKYSEAQQNYYSWMTDHTGVICIPYTCSDPEITSAVMEALFEESYYALRGAYRDKAIKYQSTRDDESVDMLEIIFNNTVYDIGFIYNIGGVYSALNEPVKSHAVSSVRSTINKYRDKVTADIADILLGYE